MSSKRALYKPAAQSDVGAKSGRQPLSQGRLIVQSPLTQLSSKLSTEENQVQHSGMIRSFTGPSVSVSVLGSQNSKPRTMSAELGLSPRRTVPNVSTGNSPRIQPTPVLDISDSEDGHFHSGRSQKDTNVIVLDASRQTVAPDQADVDIRLGYERSPVKVVCHSPPRTTQLRESGSLAEARRIEITSVPTLRRAEMSDDDSLGEALPRSNLTPPRTLVVRENSIVGGPIDKNSFARLEVVEGENDENLRPIEASSRGGVGFVQRMRLVPGQSSSNCSSENSLPESQVAFGMAAASSKANEMSSSNVAPGPVKKHDDMAQPISDKRIVDSGSAIGSKADTKENNQNKMRHTKEFRIVSSRYKEAASVVKGPIKATDRAPLNRPSATIDKLKLKQPNVASSIGKSAKARSEKLQTSENIANTARSSTPDMFAKQMVGAKNYSTVASESMFQPLGNDSINLSAIAPLQYGGHSSATIGPGFADNSMMGTDGELLPKSSSLGQSAFHQHQLQSSILNSSTKKKQNREVTQTELDLLYTLYLQSVMLTCRARKSFEDKEKQAMAQLAALDEYNDRLRRRKMELDKELIRLEHLNMLDEMLDIQESGLSQISAAVPQYEQQHSQLSQALHATRHQVQTVGICLPEDEGAFDDAMTRALQESEYLLGELSTMSRQQTPQIAALAKQVEALENSVDIGTKQLDRCQELLAAVNSLVTHETSLKVQQIQSME